MKYTFFIFLLFYFINYKILIGEDFINSMDSDKKKIQYIEKWTKIENVALYRLEIFDLRNNLILSKETNNTEVEVQIPPGKYKKRLGLINKFNKLFMYTDFIEFEILEIPNPEILNVQKETLNENSQTIEITIEGLIDDTKIFLKKNDISISVPYKKLGKNKIQLLIDTKKFESGNYSLLIKNSEKKTTEIKNILTIDKSPLVSKKYINQKSDFWKFVVPGYIQKENGYTIKGNIFQWGFLTSALMTNYFYNKSINLKKKYNSLIITQNGSNIIIFQYYAPFLQNTFTTIFLLYQSQQANSILKDFNYNKNMYLFSMGMSAVLYTFHIIDIYKFDFYYTPNKQMGVRFSFYY